MGTKKAKEVLDKYAKAIDCKPSEVPRKFKLMKLVDNILKKETKEYKQLIEYILTVWQIMAEDEVPLKTQLNEIKSWQRELDKKEDDK